MMKARTIVGIVGLLLAYCWFIVGLLLIFLVYLNHFFFADWKLGHEARADASGAPENLWRNDGTGMGVILKITSTSHQLDHPSTRYLMLFHHLPVI